MYVSSHGSHQTIPSTSHSKHIQKTPNSNPGHNLAVFIESLFSLVLPGICWGSTLEYIVIASTHITVDICIELWGTGSVAPGTQTTAGSTVHH